MEVGVSQRNEDGAGVWRVVEDRRHGRKEKNPLPTKLRHNERYLPTNEHSLSSSPVTHEWRNDCSHHKRSRGDMVNLIEGSSLLALPVRSDIGSNISSSCTTVDNTSIQEYNKENEDPNAVTSLLLQHKNTRASAPLPTNIAHNRGTL
jgi:hypothetical protein